jgi:hypothetical protein
VSSFAFWVQVIGLTALALSAIFLWLGSAEMPWAMQTWKGESEPERAFRRRRSRYARTGFLLLASGYVLQLLLLLTQSRGR